MKLVTIVGARPQFVKAAMLSRAIEAHNHSVASREKIIEVLVHTGQHYDYEMSSSFFHTLELRAPEYELGVGSGAQGWQTGEILKRAEEVLVKEAPDMVVVYGDTNSTLAGALAAAKLHLPVAHVEAGLRSFNRSMPEELNRVLTDHLSDLLFVPTATAVTNLEREGITKGVFLAGDVMLEAALEHLHRAQTKSSILRDLGLQPGGYALATVHRPSNTDLKEPLEQIVQAFTEISKTCPVIWPMHPRARKALESFSLLPESTNGLKTLPPVAYEDMLLLEASARVILTDSGGVQKEARWFNVPCVTLREETEWIETLEDGWNRLAGSDRQKITEAFHSAIGSRCIGVQPSESQRAAETMVRHIVAFGQNSGGCLPRP
ncbi:MAG TPA: UDP-N-acetylglucosamine 2-epimerase (non-hydrolyzing) [Candidatus Angelobacter sp.]